MDTDDLSRETYEGVLLEAERFTHDLTLLFALLAQKYSTEEDYLEAAEGFSKELLDMDRDELEDLFWGDAPERNGLVQTANRILANIAAIRRIPVKDRHYD